jgi:hypothetical protein
VGNVGSEVLMATEVAAAIRRNMRGNSQVGERASHHHHGHDPKLGFDMTVSSPMAPGSPI